MLVPLPLEGRCAGRGSARGPFGVSAGAAALALSLACLLISPRTHAASGRPDADRQYRFAMLLASREDLDRAEAEFRLFMKQHPADPRCPEVEFWLAYTLHKASKSAGAARILDRWLAKNARHELADRALFWRGEALSSAGRGKEARASWREAVTRFPRSPRAANSLDSLGWSHFRAGEWREALAAFGEIRRRFPDDKALVEGARRLTGECLLRLGRAKEALAEFDSLIGSPPRGGAPVEVEARFGRANALQALSRTGEAAKEFGRVVELALKTGSSPDLVPEAMLSQASALVTVGKPKDALEVIERLSRRGDRGTAWYRAGFWRGLALEALGRVSEAARAYESTLATPGAREVHGRAAWQLAELRYRTKDPLGAVAAYDRVIALGRPPDLVEKSLYNSSVTLSELGRIEDALTRVEKLLRDFREGTQAADALYAAGDFLVRLDRPRDAARRYGDFLARFPRDRRSREARYRRGWCLHAAGSFEAARAELEALLRQDPRGKEAAEAAFLLGEAARKSGDLEAARRAYRRTLEALGLPGGSAPDLSPAGGRAAEAMWALASIARDSKRPEEARDVALDLVRGYPRSKLVPWAMLLAADSALSLAAAEGASGRDASQPPSRPSSASAGGDGRPQGGRTVLIGALAGYRGLLDRFPGHELAPAARSGAAWALTKLGKRDEALVAFRELARAHPETRFGAEALYRAAVLLREAGRPGEAAPLLDELLRRSPPGRFAEAAGIERARVMRDRGDSDGAVRELELFETRFPRSDLLPDALRELALAHSCRAQPSRRDRERARAAWRRIVARFPRSDAAFDAHIGLAEIAEDEDDLAVAERHYASASASASRPGAAGAAFRRADCLEKLGRPTEAAGVFLDVAKRFPRSAEAASALVRAGRLAADSGAAERAVELFRRAEAASPGVAALDLARALRASGKAGEAVRILERHLGDPDVPGASARPARLELALALGALGRHADAEARLRQVIRGGDDEVAAEAQHALAGSLAARGDLRAAERAYYELLLLYPFEKWQAAARFRLGESNERLHDYSRARDFYAELLRENPKSPYARRARERIEALSP